MTARSIGKSSLTISAKPDGVGGFVSTVDSQERTIFVADAHRGDGKPYSVRADERLTAFEMALVLDCLHHVAPFIVNANHGTM
jgi:hypothetical protein